MLFCDPDLCTKVTNSAKSSVLIIQSTDVPMKAAKKYRKFGNNILVILRYRV